MKFSHDIIQPAVRLVDPRLRKKGGWLLPLLILQSLLDVASVASLAPMALLIVHPDSAEHSRMFRSLYRLDLFQDTTSFALAWVAAVVVFFLVKHAVSLVITRTKAQFVFDVSSSLSRKMMDHFMGVSYSRFHELQSSMELVKIAHLPNSFGNNILQALLTLLSESVVLLLLIGTLVMVDWRSILFLLVISIPSIIYYRLLQAKLGQINESLKINYPGLIKYVLQLFDNFIEINLYKRSHHFGKNVEVRNNELNQIQVVQSLIQANSFRLFETTAAIGLCALIVYVILAKTPPESTVLILGLYTAAGFRAIPSLNRIFISLFQIKTNEHVLTVLNQFKDLGDAVQDQNKLVFDSTLKLDHISFGYRGKPLVLDNLSISIKKGEKIAITGISGSGKTTLLLVLMRFLQENSGRISVDDVVLQNTNIHAWRSHLSYVPQSPVMLDGTVTDNILFGANQQPADEKRIMELLLALGLNSWVERLPMGLMTPVGEKGVQLSGGQRQRIAIARALFNNSDMLLLDEATSQVDTLTESEIHNALTSFPPIDRTLIMVTHRKTSLHLFDRIFHLENGKLTEVMANT